MSSSGIMGTKIKPVVKQASSRKVEEIEQLKATALEVTNIP